MEAPGNPVLARDAVPSYAKDRPFPGRITEARLLNRPGSSKETRHFVVAITGSGMHYKPGDSLGVWPSNAPSEMAELMERIDASGDEIVSLPRVTEAQPAVRLPLREALADKLSLAGPTRRFVEFLAGKTPDADEKARLGALLADERKGALAEFLAQREFVDLLAEFPGARPAPQELVAHMRRLMPRLYSIASAPALYPSEVHLTVAVVRYRTNNRERKGVCSTFLAERAHVGSTRIPVFVSHAHFGLPEDPSADIIMVGPGTGIAPFRAFVQQRVATRAPGRNWLFFGEQHAATDFLYEEEWRCHVAQGGLARLNTAFSRDQEAKIYVQDRMREHAGELWKWLKAGAFFYVCGDAKRMAKDVDAALHDIVAQQGGLPAPAAADYVKGMKKERRYQRDVY
jgi:sulfite reductase (NADPH) flavoprotein alpha-component